MPNIGKDIRDLEVEDLLGYDAILHLAGLSNDPLGFLNPETTFDINYRASVRLAETAKCAGVRRFLYASSCSNYGKAGDEFIDETGASNPVTPYGESKVLAETRPSKACRRPLLSNLSALRDGLRRFTTAPLRSSAEQFGGLGDDHRRHSSQVGRHAVAAHCAH